METFDVFAHELEVPILSCNSILALLAAPASPLAG